MRITKQQKLGIGGLGLALCALVIDRCVLQTGDLAQQRLRPFRLRIARQPYQTRKGCTVSRRKQAAGATGGLAKLIHESKADNGFDPSDVVDAFRPAASWSPAGGREGTVSVANANEFVHRHELKAVMAGVNGDGLVIIDSRCLRIGQSLDGFRLVSISTGSVILTVR